MSGQLALITGSLKLISATLIDLKEDVAILKLQSNNNNSKVVETLETTSDNIRKELSSFCGMQLSMMQQIENTNEEDSCTKRFPN